MIVDLDQPDDVEIADFSIGERRNRHILFCGFAGGVVGMLLPLWFPRGLGSGGFVEVGMFAGVLLGFVEWSPRRRAFEREVRRRRIAKGPSMRGRIITSVPVLVCVVMFVVGAIVSPEALAMVPASIRSGRELWTLLSSALVHGSPGHFIGNAIALVLFGIPFDLRVGRAWTVVVLLLSALGGALAHAAFTAMPEIPAVGSSGAVFGLVGGMLALAPSRRMLIVASGFRAALPAYLTVPVYFGGMIGLQALAMPHVAYLAHLGGIITGAGCGLLLRRLPVPEAFERYERLREQRIDQVDG